MRTHHLRTWLQQRSRAYSSLILITLLSASQLSQAQPLYSTPRNSGEAKIGELSDPDRRFMQRQKSALDDIARRYMGRQFSGFNRGRDIELMQAMLDRGVIRKTQIAELQGMGYVVGDYLQKELGLRWVSYEDYQGRSRALSIPGKPEYVFPATLISSRYSKGATVNVASLYLELQDEVRRIKQHVYMR